MKEYRIGKPIGYGASSTILEAWRRMPDGTEQPVAVKRLLPELHGNPDIARRFVREATLCMDIAQDHPNLVSVHDFHRSNDGQLHMVMERVDGISLDRLPSLPWPAIRYVLREAAHGLGFIHEHGILHRDISPRNVLVTRDGTVKILDFGLARFLDTPRSDLGFKGTAPYSSPEAIQCLDLDASADLYSLAAVGYQLITGKAPYGPGSAVRISRKMVTTTIEPMASDVPEDLAALIMGLLQPWEQRTIRTASQLLDALGEPIAEPQDIARIVQGTCDAQAGPLLESEPGETWSITPRRPRARESNGSHTLRAALLPLGLIAAALTVYLVLARGQERETHEPPISTIEASSATEPPGPAQVIIESKESGDTGPGQPIRESDLGQPRPDAIDHEESKSRDEQAPKHRSRRILKPKKHDSHFVPVPEGGDGIYIFESIDKGNP